MGGRLLHYLANIPQLITMRKKKSGIDAKFKAEMDELRSEGGAYIPVTATAQVGTNLVASQLATGVLAGKKWHMRTLEITNRTAGSVLVYLGDGGAATAANQRGVYILGGNETFAITDIKGKVFTQALYYNVSTQPVFIAVGGVFEVEE